MPRPLVQAGQVVDGIGAVQGPCQVGFRTPRQFADAVSRCTSMRLQYLPAAPLQLPRKGAADKSGSPCNAGNRHRPSPV